MNKNIDEINEFYKRLNIKTRWSETSLTIDEINLVTDTFGELHIMYPNVIIEEIGDCYTEDVEKREERIKNATQLIEEDYTVNDYYKNNEYFKAHPDKRSDHQNIMRKLYAETINENIRVNDDKYINAKFSAQYFSYERKIKLNHVYKNKLKENTIHEFGHAVAYQYDINSNKIINDTFNRTTKILIEELVTEYATTDVEEFIAEIFMKYHLGIRNSIIDSIMCIVDGEVKNGKPMSVVQREINIL